MVTQREVNVDVPNFAEALRRALRQDPDVILVGELRDLETMEAAITAAETGHLVFGTLHTTGAAKTIDRIVNAFPANQQETDSHSAFHGVAGGHFAVAAAALGQAGRVAVLRDHDQHARPSAALIRDNKTFRINSDIQTGAKYGMVTLDSFLMEKYQAGMISREEVVNKSQDPDDGAGEAAGMGNGAGRRRRLGTAQRVSVWLIIFPIRCWRSSKSKA